MFVLTKHLFIFLCVRSFQTHPRNFFGIKIILDVWIPEDSFHTFPFNFIIQYNEPHLWKTEFLMDDPRYVVWILHPRCESIYILRYWLNVISPSLAVCISESLFFTKENYSLRVIHSKQSFLFKFE